MPAPKVTRGEQRTADDKYGGHEKAQRRSIVAEENEVERPKQRGRVGAGAQEAQVTALGAMVQR